MSERIYKYPIEVTDLQRVTLPSGAEILTVQVQRDAVCIWAIVDPDVTAETRVFRMIGTGHDIDFKTDPEHARHIGTFQLHGGTFVFHLFEIL